MPHARRVYFATERRAVEPGSVGRQVLVVTAEDEQVLEENCSRATSAGPATTHQGRLNNCAWFDLGRSPFALMTRFVAEVRP